MTFASERQMDGGGCRCPECNSACSDVTDSRSHALGIRRRRRCKACRHRWTTMEVRVNDVDAVRDILGGIDIGLENLSEISGLLRLIKATLVAVPQKEGTEIGHHLEEV